MKHKIEAVDYLRGFSILAVILLHLIFTDSNKPSYFYSSIPHIFDIRDFLNFSIVTIILCSGFSLYLAAKDLSLDKKQLIDFYKKRLKRLLFPWWAFLTIALIIYEILRNVFNLELRQISLKYAIGSYLLLGGVPLAWLILTMILLTLLFPFLKYYYEKDAKNLVLFMFLAYSISSIIYMFNPIDIYKLDLLNISFVGGISFIFSFISGWCLVYVLGFYLEKLYNQHKLMTKELKITFNFIILFFIIRATYKFLELDTSAYANKYPPSPYYLSFGIAVTFIILNLFFAYKEFIHVHLKRIFAFFSDNSYWIYLWSALAWLVSKYVFSAFLYLNPYILLLIEFTANCIFASLIVILQKKLIKIEMHLQKHHF